MLPWQLLCCDHILLHLFLRLGLLLLPPLNAAVRKQQSLFLASIWKHFFISLALDLDPLSDQVVGALTLKPLFIHTTFTPVAVNCMCSQSRRGAD